MQCVILAAGEGKRMRPLTDSLPKPLVRLNGVPILEHILLSLPQSVDEVILVIGYLGEQIRAYMGAEFDGMNIRYVVQDKKLGTGHALKLAEPYLHDAPFLFMYADDLHGADDLKNAVIRSSDTCPVVLVAEHSEPRKFGVVTLNADGSIAGVAEKPEVPRSNLVSTGAMVLDKRIFEYEPEEHPSGELYLTSMIEQFLRDHPIYVCRSEYWYPIASAEDVKGAERFLSENLAGRV